jgi:hypothetical protein
MTTRIITLTAAIWIIALSNLNASPNVNLGNPVKTEESTSKNTETKETTYAKIDYGKSKDLLSNKQRTWHQGRVFGASSRYSVKDRVRKGRIRKHKRYFQKRLVK